MPSKYRTKAKLPKKTETFYMRELHLYTEICPICGRKNDMEGWYTSCSSCKVSYQRIEVKKSTLHYTSY